MYSGEFITADVEFSAPVLFMRPETKGCKRGGYSPRQKLWEDSEIITLYL